MEGDAVVEPIGRPSVCRSDAVDHAAQPIRPRIFQWRHVRIFGRKAEIAREHQRGPAVDGNLQRRSRSSGGAADLIEGRQQFVAIQSFGHVRTSEPPSFAGFANRGRRPGPRIIGTKPGKLVAMNEASSIADRLFAREPHDQERHGDAVIHVGRDRAAAERPAPCRARSGRRRRSRPRPRSPRSPSATAASRSDSFTRSSLSPRMTVVPSAKLAATASTGYSSIIEGARAAGTSTPRSADARTRKSAISSPTSLRASSVSIVGAHLAQGGDQPGAQRIGHDVGQDHLRARHQQGRHHREGGRRRIGRHHDRRRRRARARPAT